MNKYTLDIIRNSVGKISKFVFFANSSEDIPRDLCEYFDDCRFYIISSNGQFLVKNKKWIPIKLSEISDTDTIFVCDEKTDLHCILEYKDIIHNITGSIDSRKIDYFELWECLQGCVENIYIQIFVNKLPRMLKWSRSDSEIELSIVFPVYNVEKYLLQCFESVTQWDAPYIEFLAVNDGSTDDSLLILEKLAQKDSRIKILTKENGGCASARQYGLERARGRYVGFIDPDDYIAPEMFCDLLKAAFLGSFEVAQCGFIKFFEKEPDKSYSLQESYLKSFQSGTYYIPDIRSLLAYSEIAIWRGIYLKDFLIKNCISFKTELKRYDDLPFHKEVMLKASSLITVNKPMYYYRLGRPGQDVAITDERLFVHFEIFEHLDKVFDKSLVDERELYLLALTKVNTHLWALGKIDKKIKKEYLKKAKEDTFRNVNFFKLMLYSKNIYGISHALSILKWKINFFSS